MQSRQEQLEKMQESILDILVIGGGVNGAVSAWTLSAAGMKTALIDQSDFASMTSQESSSLAWGGIKYLESYEFSLVWGLCRSRNELLRVFPSQVKEVRFFTTLQKKFRKPRVLVFLGSVLYWVMGRFFTRPPRLLSKQKIEQEEPEIDASNSQGGVEYSDSYFVDTDARFVFNLVKNAAKQGAYVANYARAKSWQKDSETGDWLVVVEDKKTQKDYQLRAKVIVNACGPLADKVNTAMKVVTDSRHVFSKGVHLLVPQLSKKERILTFFADDGRMFFVIPMMGRSCIGTTDTRVEELPAEVSEEDRDFILSNINARLKLARPLTRSDIIAERCGVRPLVVDKASDSDEDDWLNLSRKHVIEVDKKNKVVGIFGGKLTDCLNVGREILAITKQWVSEPVSNRAGLSESKAKKAEFLQTAEQFGLASESAQRLWRRFDLDAFEILDSWQSSDEMRKTVLAKAAYSRAEILYMARSEMITSLDDFFRRRSGLAMAYSKKELMEDPGIEELAQLLFGEDAKKAIEIFKE